MPTRPEAVVALVIEGVPLVPATVMVSVAAPVPLELVAPRTTEVVPAVVGVPEMTPVAVLTVRPAGSGLAANDVGEPEAVMAKVNAAPIVPEAVSGLLVMTGAAPSAPTVMVSVAEPVPPPLVAPSVTLVVAAVVGVPEMRPFAVLTVKPAGRPAAEKLVGVFDAVIWKLNALPTVPPAVSGLLVMTGATAADATVSVSVALPVPDALVAPRVTLEVAAVVGVPLMRPFAVLIVRPAGRPAAEKLVGLFDAVIWKLKAEPTVPLAVSGELVIAGAGGRIVSVAELLTIEPEALVATTS